MEIAQRRHAALRFGVTRAPRDILFMNQQVWEFFVGLFVLWLIWACFSILSNLKDDFGHLPGVFMRKVVFLRYYTWRESRRWKKYEAAWEKTRHEILEDKIARKKEWLIPKAAGYEWVLISKMARAIRDEKIPHAKLWWGGILYEHEDKRSPVLVVSHERLLGMELYFGSRDYGEYLKSFYIVVYDSVPLEIEREGVRIAEKRSSGKLSEADEEELARRHYEAKALMTRRDEAYGVRSVDNFTETNLREIRDFFGLLYDVIEKNIKEFEDNLGREKILAGATKGFVDII